MPGQNRVQQAPGNEVGRPRLVKVRQLTTRARLNKRRLLGCLEVCHLVLKSCPTTGKRPLCGFGAQTCHDGVLDYVINEVFNVFGAANQVIEGFPLPQCPPAAQLGVDLARCEGLPGVQNVLQPKDGYRLDHHVNMIGHYTPSTDAISLSLKA